MLTKSTGVFAGRIVSARERECASSQGVHHVIAITFIGTRPFAGAHIRHLNCNKLDNRVCNLAYGTAKENGHDTRLKSGSWAFSISRVQKKLLRMEIGNRLRALYKGGGYTLEQIGEIVGVGVSAACRIVKGNRLLPRGKHV